MFFSAFDGKHLLHPVGVCPGRVGRELEGGLSCVLTTRLLGLARGMFGTWELGWGRCLCVRVCVRQARREGTV